MNAKLRVAGMIALGALAGALATIQLQAFARNAAAPLPLEELQQLAAVFGMVKSDYVEAVDEKKLIGDAISGMVAGLDPHSQYFDKKTLKEFREQTGGRFVGVGIEIGMEDGLVKVQSPIEGSPAFRAGIKSGDLITRIDETAVKGLTMDQAVKRMRGEPNTKVSLTIFRKSENRTLPGGHHARGDPHPERALQDPRTRLRLAARQPVPGPHRRRLRAQARRHLQAGAQPQGPGARPAQRPGRPARRGGGHLGRLPARERGGRHHQRPDRRVEGHLQGRAGVLRAPRRQRPAEAPAGGREDGAAGGAGQRRLGLGQRDRRRGAAGPQARHHHGRADLRQGLGADGAPAVGRHGAEDHHGALLHAFWQGHSGQGSGAGHLAGRNRRRQCLRRAAHARGRSEQAPDWRRREEGRRPLQGPRGRACEARGTAGQAEGAAEAAAGVRHRRGLPVAAGAEPADASGR